MIERYPVHVHLHPHATVADYDGVRALVAQEEDPFLLFMPEAADSQTLTHLQKISDGNRRILSVYKRHDEDSRFQGISFDANAARGRALAEAIFDSGVYVVGIHPEWDEQTMLDNAVALGKNRALRPTFTDAIETLQHEMPEMARVIEQRDQFASDNFLERAEAAVAATSDFDDLDQVPCLVEIGSLHFGLADLLSDKGFTVTTSGDSPDSLMGAQQQGLAHILQGGSVEELDLERIAFEDALCCIIKARTSYEAQTAVDHVVSAYDDRSQWPAHYESISRDVRTKRV